MGRAGRGAAAAPASRLESTAPARAVWPARPAAVPRLVAPASGRGLIRPHHSKFALAARVADGGLVAAGLWLALWLSGHPWTDSYTVAAALGAVLFMLFAEWRDVYRGWRGAPLAQELSQIVAAWLGVAITLLFVAFVVKRTDDFSRLVTGSWAVVTPVVLSAWRTTVRLGLRHLRRRGRNIRTVAVAGAGDLGVRLMRRVLSNRWMGLHPNGFFDDSKAAGQRPIPSEKLQILGDLDEMVSRARAGHIDIVYLALPLRAEERMRQIVSQLADTPVAVYLVPDIFTFDLCQARLVTFGGIPTVSVFENPFRGVEGWVKRLEDIVAATLILLVCAIPMAIIAAAVKLSSKGPVIYRQRRYGLDGRKITVWKFRTMKVCEDDSVFTQATRRDPRVTRVGAFLRRTSLDELPQFFNVLQGRMSVVGPRPHPVALNEQYRNLIHGYMLRHRVKPGITGWAQVNGFRGETETLDKMTKRIEHDLWYIRNWSLWLDLRIVARTILHGFTGTNAY